MPLRSIFAFLGLVAIVALAGLRLTQVERQHTAVSTSPAAQASAIAVFKSLVAQQSDPRLDPHQVRLSNDARGAKVDLAAVQQGCAVQDCIPAITEPQFDSAAAASRWLHDGDVVFGISYRGVLRAYPQRILNWHEIVNDTMAGDPILVTFCPLCGSALAFQRMVDRHTVTFGVSGLLYNSDLIMYDRRTGSLWQQFTGQAIVGPPAQRNEHLRELLIITTTWGAWKQAHPTTEVLSRQTGYDRNYDQYPYGSYEHDNELYFGIQHTDRRLPLKTVVYGVEVAGAAKAYTADVLRERRTIADVVGCHRIVIREDASGRVSAVDRTGRRTILPLRTFWFAWATFYPNTELLGNTPFRPTPVQGICPGPTCRVSRERLKQPAP
jgi:hypothetical protein